MARIFRAEPVEYWIDLLGDAGLPVGRVLTLAEAFDDPQARHHNMLVEFEHPAAGHVRTTGSPIRLDGAPSVSENIPPVLGEHTRLILSEVGIDEGTIEKMIKEGKATAP